MKLKYYMRGLGTGILFSVVVMSLTGANGKDTMSDSEIIHAAKKLGMVESQSNVNITGLKATQTPTLDNQGSTQDMTLTENSSLPEDSTTPEPTPSAQITQLPEATTSSEVTVTPEPTVTSEPTVTPTPVAVEPTKAPEVQGGGESSSETIILIIEKGMYSQAISEEAYRVGLVDDAKRFDDYLITNNYASTIRIGVYEFEQGATYSQIAEKIASRP